MVEIKIEGHVDKDWTEWFCPLSEPKDRVQMTHLPNGETVITGPLADQSALRGILTKIWDLGLTLNSVSIIGENTAS